MTASISDWNFLFAMCIE